MTRYFKQLYFKAYKQFINEEKNMVPEPILPGLNLTGEQLFFVSYAQVSQELNDHEIEILNINH